MTNEEIWPYLNPIGKLHDRFEQLLIQRFPFFPPLWGSDNIGLARYGGRKRLCYHFGDENIRPIKDISADLKVLINAAMLYNVWNRYLKAESAFNIFTKEMALELEIAVKNLESQCIEGK